MTVAVKPNLEESWLRVLAAEFEKNYMLDLKKFLLSEKKKFRVYPKGVDMFNAFTYAPFDLVRVVILGQDPYHGPGQAHGLCFSVQEGVPQPPSLINIFKELENDLGYRPPVSGNLEKWARQGVFLLNTTLSVRERKPQSHFGKGWEVFTDEVIRQLSDQKEHLIFMLWGKFAQQKSSLINEQKHLILKTTHPSPLSASYGFLGSRHFSKANAYLEKNNLKAIDWNLQS